MEGDLNSAGLSKDDEELIAYASDLSPIDSSPSYQYVATDWEDECVPLPYDTNFLLGMDGDESGSANCSSSLLGMDGDESGSANCSSSQKSKSKMLSKETISQYYYKPIKVAAKEMGINDKVLSKRCRELGISRWPYRKLNSIQRLEKNAQNEEDLELLRKEKKLIVEVLDAELDEKTLQLWHASDATQRKRKSRNAPA